LEIWNVELNSIAKKNRGTSSIQLNILILQLTVRHLEGNTKEENNSYVGFKSTDQLGNRVGAG
jgi:hypothetical protein